MSGINIPSTAATTGFGTVAGVGHHLGYARVSTSDQEPGLQLDALREAGCYRIFTECVSGAAQGRPQLDALLDQLRPGDTLVVWRLDRLGRSLKHLLETTTALRERDVGFRSLVEQIDTTTPAGKLVFHLFAALAEFERDLIVERTSAGLAAARARGRQGGRPAMMTPAKLAAARQMHAAGTYTMAEIAAAIGVGRSTLYRHFIHPAAAGLSNDRPQDPTPMTSQLGPSSRSGPAGYLRVKGLL